MQDVSNFTMEQLVTAYNELLPAANVVGKNSFKEVTKFVSLADGRKRYQRLAEFINNGGDPAPSTVGTEALPEQQPQEAEASGTTGEDSMQTQETTTAPRKAPAKKASSKKAAKGKKATKKANGAAKKKSVKAEDTRVIKLLVKENPRRPGTRAHEVFGKLLKKGGGKFVDLRDSIGYNSADLASDLKNKFIQVSKG